jgi:phosphoserine phosphatase
MMPLTERLVAAGWPTHISSAIATMIAEHGLEAPGYDPLVPPLAAFDWDDTCMKGDISHEALAHIEENDPQGRVEAYERHCAEDLHAAYEALVHTLMTGRTREQAQQLSEDALQRGLSQGHIHLRPGMRAIVEAMQLAGWIVRVVTASPAPLVQPLAYRYGIPPDHVLGMTSETERGRFLPKLSGIVTIGQGKLAAIREHAGRDPVFSAGDSWSDHALMAASRYVLLRDKGDEGLRSEAEANGWWVVDKEDA